MNKLWPRIRLTNNGSKKIEEVFPPHLIELSDYFSVLSADEKKP